MKYLLDSNIVSEMHDKFSVAYVKIAQKFFSLTDHDQLYISILTLYELEYGHANAPEEKKPNIRQKIREVQEDFEVLPLSPPGAKLFGVLKKALKESRRLTQENVKKHNIDVMMAAIAITENCILVSTDAIYLDLHVLNPELRWENWLK
jgi:predicted nucleic acid-binding protein